MNGLTTQRVDPIELIDRLLSEARERSIKLHTALMHENRKLGNQLEDARDAIAERDARIKELEEKLASAGDNR